MNGSIQKRPRIMSAQFVNMFVKGLKSYHVVIFIVTHVSEGILGPRWITTMHWLVLFADDGLLLHRWKMIAELVIS